MRDLARRVVVRYHLVPIVAGALCGGALASRVLSAAGVEALTIQYAVAVAVAYGVFLALVILPEAALETATASRLLGITRRGDFGPWAGGLVRATALPFTLVLMTAVLVGWTVQWVCPAALGLFDALGRCH